MAGKSRLLRMQQRVRQQVEWIKEGFKAKGVDVVYVPAPNGGVSYICHAAQILVQEPYLERVRNVLGQPGVSSPVIADIVLLTLDLPALERFLQDKKVPFDQDHPPVSAALELVDQALGEGIATPDHVLTVCDSGDGVVAPCPATEPRVVEDGIEPYPGVQHCCGTGAGVLIYVADTGLLKDADKDHDWLQGVLPAIAGQWDPDPPVGSFIPSPYTGHGTFVAGVIRCMAPQADVVVSDAFKISGSALESHFVPHLRRALRLGVDIFHLSVAAPSRNDLPLIAFERWLKLLRQYKGVVCVVAAGNSGARSPSWPAAFSRTVAVGALTADGRDRAGFSNYGGWVDVYAPGRDLINAYTHGTYEYHDAPYTGDTAEFYGMAKWSGTSFSTPIVTGLIAARMSRTGEDGQEAADSLLREARCRAIPGVGAIVLPTCCEHEEGRRFSATCGHIGSPCGHPCATCCQ